MAHAQHVAHRLAAAAIAVAAACAPARVAAQGKTTVPDHIPITNGEGLALNLFQPAVDARGFLSVNGADILDGSELSLGFVSDYGYGLLPESAGHGGGAMVTHAWKGVFQFAYGIANLLVVGISLPVVVNDGPAAVDIGPGASAGKGGKNANYDSDALSTQAIGDLALSVKVPILRPSAPIGLALLARAGVGVGGARNFAAEPGFFYWPELIVEKRFGERVRLGLDVGYRGHTGAGAVFGLGKDKAPELAHGVLGYGNLFTAAFAVSVRPTRRVDLLAETYLTYAVGGPSAAKQRPSAEALGGLKVLFDKNTYLCAALGPGYAPGFQTARFRAVVGFVYEPAVGARAAAPPAPPPIAEDPPAP
jgi:hypothetical protein